MIRSVIVAVLLLNSISCWSQETIKKFTMNIPTIEQEASSIWRTINDIKFFEEKGYSVNLPNDKLIDTLIVKSKNGTFSNQDYSLIYELLESKIYNKSDYRLAHEKVENQEQLINTIILQLDSLRKIWNWDFKIYESYTIIFTLYGSGGSYDPSTGTVTLFTTIQGNFKKYENPTNTIIHEIIHIGLEESIVQQYNIPHTLKEEIVDRIVFLLFNSLLPQYEVQRMGDSKIDGYLKEIDDIKNLKKVIEAYNQ